MKFWDKYNLNKYVISFLIIVITLFGSLSFIIDKNVIDSLTNYVVIIIAFLGGVILFFNNLEEFSWKNIRKVPLILSILTFLWFLFGSFFGIRLGIENIKGIINYGCLLALGFIILNIKLNDDDKKAIINSVLISFLICALLGIFQYYSGINLIQYSNSLYPGILGRINSTFYIATILDKYVVLIEIILMYLLLKKPKNIFYILLFILSGITITLTFSRSGLLVYFFIAFIFLVISLFSKKFSNVVLIIVTVLTMLFINGATYSIQSGLDFVYDKLDIPNYFRVNLNFINDFKDTLNHTFKPSNDGNTGTDVEEPIPNLSIDYREKYQKVGLDLIEKYPVFGIGVGNYSYLYNNQNFKDYVKNPNVLLGIDTVMYPHNAYIQVACEMGYIGLTLLCLSFFCYLFYCDYKSDKLKLFASFLLIIALLFAGYTETVFSSKQYIFIFIILLSFLSCKTSIKKEVNND